MKTTMCRPIGRFFYWPILIALMVFAVAVDGMAATPAKTAIVDTLYRADGSPASGTILISWPAFATNGGDAVAAGSMSLKIGAQGALNVSLVPNTASTPASTYKVTLKLADGTTSDEYWTVPAVATTTVAAIRSKVVPAVVAQQFVSRDYVDTKLAQVSGGTDFVGLSGNESISGVKTFMASPQVPAPLGLQDAAPKKYVDDKTANALSSANTYQDPAWLGSIAASKLTGVLADAVIPASVMRSTNTYQDPSWLGSVGASKLMGVLADAAIPAGVARTANANSWSSAQTDAALHTFNNGIVVNGLLSGFSGTNSALNIKSVQPAVDGGGATMPLGGDILVEADGPADIHLRTGNNGSGASTTSTTSLTGGGGAQSITVGSTASFYSKGGLMLDQYTANEESLNLPNYAIVDGTHFTVTPLKSHTQPFNVTQAGSLRLDTFQTCSFDVDNVSPVFCTRNTSTTTGVNREFDLHHGSSGQVYFRSGLSGDHIPRWYGHGNGPLLIYGSNGGAGSSGNIKFAKNDADDPSGANAIVQVDPNNGIVYSNFFMSKQSANIAGSGTVRLSVAEKIGFRNLGNSGDHTIGINGSDNFALDTGLALGGTLSVGGGASLATSNQTGTGNLVLASGPTVANINETGSPLTNGTLRLFNVAADFTTAANTNLQTITGLSWTLASNTAQNVPFSCHLAYSQGTAAAAVSFGIQAATVSPTNIFATGAMYTSATASTGGVLATLSNTTATAIVTATPGATGTVFVADIDGLIENPSSGSANTINLMVKTATAADAVTVKRGSYCRLY
jgi:hypothetical protein